MKKVLAVLALVALVFGFAPIASATDPIVVNSASCANANVTCAAAAAAYGTPAVILRVQNVQSYGNDVQAFNAYGANAQNVVRVQNVHGHANVQNVFQARNQHVQAQNVVRVQNVVVKQQPVVVQNQVRVKQANATDIRVQSAGNSNIKVEVNDDNDRRGGFLSRLRNR